MRLIRLAAAAAFGALAMNTLLAAPRRNGRRDTARRSSTADAGGTDVSTGLSTSGDAPFGARADQRPSSARATADSPNAAERLAARHPAGALAEAGAIGLGLDSPEQGEVEYARSTGLADFARGA